MTQTLRFITTWVFFATLFLALAGWLHINGFLSESTVRIWSKVILQLDGPPGFKSSESLYPPLPFFFSMVLHNLVGASGIPTPTLASSVVASLLATCIYQRITDHAQYPPMTAMLILVLVLGNPISLYAITAAPEMTFLFFGLWVLSNGLFRLRKSGSAPDMMQVGIGLMLVGLSSSYGLLLCLSALPFLAISAPPRLIITSATGTILAVFFPVACAVGSLFLLSALFDTPLVAKDLEFGVSETLQTTVPLYLISGGLAVLAMYSIRRDGQSVVPMLCMIGTVICATFLDLSISYFDDAFVTAAPLLVLGCVGVCAWPNRGRLRGLVVSVTAICAWFGAADQLPKLGNPSVVAWSEAISGKPSKIENAEIVARFLMEREEIMLDGEQNPELIVLLGGTDKLILNGAPEFELVAEGGRPKQSYIVLRNELSAPIIRDRLMRRFALVNDAPPRGYTIALELGEWIVLERI